MRFVVPGRSLNELLKLLGEEETPVDLQVSKKHILFTIGETSLISRLLEGEFLDYNAAIPKDCSTTVKVHPGAGLLHRADLPADFGPAEKPPAGGL